MGEKMRHLHLDRVETLRDEPLGLLDHAVVPEPAEAP